MWLNWTLTQHTMDELEQVAWLVQLQSEENILVQVLSTAVNYEVMLCLSYVHNLIKFITRDSLHEPQWKYETQATSNIFGTRAECRKTGRVLVLALRDDPVRLFQSASRVAKTTVMETKDSIKAHYRTRCVLLLWNKLIVCGGGAFSNFANLEFTTHWEIIIFN